MKNLALLDGRPLLSYAIEAAIKSGVFSRVVVNGDHEAFEPVAREFGSEFYLRPSELGSSEAKSDQVVHDFMQKYPAETVAWVNSIAPLQSAGDIRAAVEYFEKKSLDSLITVKREQAHALCGGRPVNYQENGLFERTQDLSPIETFVYSVMMWRTGAFLEAYAKQGYALMCGKFGAYTASRWSSFIIKTEDDLFIADALMRALRQRDQFQVRYMELSRS